MKNLQEYDLDMFEFALKTLNFEEANDQLDRLGYYKLEERLSAPSLEKIVREMDEICASSNELEINYGGSEHRLWNAHKSIDAAEEFRQFSNAVIPKLKGEMPEAHNILMIRNKALDETGKHLRKGRWHLDSFNRQLKIFVFLQDVGPNDGPFELIPRTQKMSTKVIHAIQAKYFRIKDFVQKTGKRGYQHIDDSFINHVEKKYPTEIFNVPAGTILIADTSAIHRAHPVNGGERYAFTSYH